jgi:hypothetical protein
LSLREDPPFSAKTPARGRLWVSDVSEILQVPPLIHGKPQAGARTDRAALHLWASRFSYQLFQPAPEQLIVVAAV